MVATQTPPLLAPPGTVLPLSVPPLPAPPGTVPPETVPPGTVPPLPAPPGTVPARSGLPPLMTGGNHRAGYRATETKGSSISARGLEPFPNF